MRHRDIKHHAQRCRRRTDRGWLGKVIKRIKASGAPTAKAIAGYRKADDSG
jgi:hypothetical protein